MSCNCQIGELSEVTLTLDNIKEECNDFIRANTYYNEIMSGTKHEGKSILLKDLFDRRKGYMTMYKYCCCCGKEIDWKQIKNDVL